MVDKKTILIVDDEPDVLTYLSTLLEDHGHHAVTAEDGARALAILAQTRPSMITLDISMPEKSGVRLYRELKESASYADIPVVIITGLSSDREQLFAGRPDLPQPAGYLSKPIVPDEILELIGKLAR